MKLSLSEKKEFYRSIDNYLASEYVKSMKQYIQHGNTTTYRHCLMVSYYSYWLCLRLHLKCDRKSIAKGALLHDFYLYDWHEPDSSHRLHGFYHSGTALANARKYFVLTPLEEDIIAKHMWPLTITKLPKHKESLVVCIVDKLCSIAEIFYLT